MGFIEIAPIKSSEELVGIWNDFNDISKTEKDMHLFSPQYSITDGMRFFLDYGQAIAVFSGENIVDYVQGPGAFVFHSAFEIAKYTPQNSAFFDGVRESASGDFPSKIDVSEITKWNILNYSDRESIHFNFSEAVYYDKKYNLNVTMQGSGCFDIGTTEVPIVSKEGDEKDFDNIGINGMSEEDKGRLAADFQELFKSALNSMRGQDIDYDKLMYHTDEIVSHINADDRIKQYLPAGTDVLSVEFSSIYPDEKSVMEIVKARRQ